MFNAEPQDTISRTHAREPLDTRRDRIPTPPQPVRPSNPEKKVLSVMNPANTEVNSRLNQVPAHLRPMMAVFLRPGIINAFVAYAERMANGEDPDLPAVAAAVAPTTATTDATAAATRSSGILSPPRRAISLGYPGGKSVEDRGGGKAGQFAGINDN